MGIRDAIDEDNLLAIGSEIRRERISDIVGELDSLQIAESQQVEVEIVVLVEGEYYSLAVGRYRRVIGVG